MNIICRRVEVQRQHVQRTRPAGDDFGVITEPILHIANPANILAILTHDYLLLAVHYTHLRVYVYHPRAPSLIVVFILCRSHIFKYCVNMGPMLSCLIPH